MRAEKRTWYTKDEIERREWEREKAGEKERREEKRAASPPPPPFYLPSVGVSLSSSSEGRLEGGTHVAKFPFFPVE